MENIISYFVWDKDEKKHEVMLEFIKMKIFPHIRCTNVKLLKLQYPERPIIAIKLLQMSLQCVNPFINTGRQYFAATRPCALTHVSELPSWSQPRQFAIVATLSIQTDPLARRRSFSHFYAARPGQPVFLMTVYSKCDFGQVRGNFTQKYVRRPTLLLLLWEERVFFFVVVCWQGF